MITILCIATEWFSKNGGLSTFNRQLCIYLAKKHKVYCYLPTFDDEEYRSAQSLSVTLIKPKGIPGLSREVCMVMKPVLPANDKIDILIGHDRITGPVMASLYEQFYKDAKTILFIHMNGAEIEWYKPEKTESDPAGVGEERERLQKELAKNVSLIAAVGPKLYSEANAYMSGIDHPPIFRFDPGLYVMPDRISYGFSWPNPEALIMGRLEDSHLKGVDIAFKAIAKVSASWSQVLSDTIGKPNLILRGCLPGKAKEFSESLNSLTPNVKTPHFIKNYSPEPDVIAEDIRRTAVLLLPSRTEGFGLVALEAISFGRPIVAGEDTGFAALLREIIPTTADDWIAPTSGPDDGVQHWAEKIYTIISDRNAAGERLKKLVDVYGARFTWERSVAALIDNVIKQSEVTYFALQTALATDIKFQGFPIWDNTLGKHVGEAADAAYSVTNQEIKVVRKNAAGRILIDILKYRPQNGEVNYIEHLAPSSTDRAINIGFDVRVTGDPINLFVILNKYKNYSWYRHGWVRIEGPDWKHFSMVRRVESNTDLTVQIQEKDFLGTATEYQIKNCRIEEWAGELAAAAKDQFFLNGRRVERLIGYRPKDIPEDIVLYPNSTFQAEIDLNKPDQKFIIYLAIITSLGKKLWLGFSGGLGTTPGKDSSEYTVHRRFPDKMVVLQENVFAAFKRGFPELNEVPAKVFMVRLRASDVDLTEITYSYKIE